MEEEFRSSETNRCNDEESIIIRYARQQRQIKEDEQRGRRTDIGGHREQGHRTEIRNDEAEL